ncbi:quinol monooxygenase YgiN [Agrobacterium vitis]|nr:quinol monooxygenase YgiN [Agrobacterium vitis]MBE1437954.1 quinol monooxygenase YgiN [Agrobacterium vitis]
MITRYALFEGSIKPGQTEAFRAAVMANILPKWQQFPGALDVRVSFAEARDDGAPEFPMILAINYPDMAAVEAALASPVRTEARAATEQVLAEFFDGRIHHHVTLANEFPL